MEQILAGFGGSMQKLDRFKDYLRSQMKKLSKEEIEFFYPIYFSHRTGQINVQTVALQCGREKFGRFKEAVAQLEEIYQLWIQSQKIERLENEKREHEMKAEQHGQRAEQHGQRAEQHGQRADEYGRQMAEHAHRAAEYGQQAQIHDAQMRQHQANVATLTMYSNHLARQNQHAEQAIIDSRHATVQQLRTLGMKP